MMTLRRNWAIGLFPLFATTACVTLAPTGRGMLILKPSFSSLNSQATVAPYTQASIQHLVLKLYQVDGGEQEMAQRDLLNAQLGNPITFSNLKANTTYRIRAYAYKAAGILPQDLISHEVSLDVAVTDNDRPSLATLNITLLDRLFDAQATGSLGIVNGGFLPVGPENADCAASVTTLAGNGTAGFADGPKTVAMVREPYHLTADTLGYVYVGDTYNSRIRKINASGFMTTVGVAAGSPVGVAVDPSGNVFFSEDGHHCIRKIDSNGVVTTIAGTGTAGFSDGTGTTAAFYWPYGLACDNLGNIYVADQGNNRIRKIDTNYVVTTVAGNSAPALVNGVGTNARFSAPIGVAVDATGNIFVADRGNHSIRKIDTARNVTTIAGNGTAGFLNGKGTSAQLHSPFGIAVDARGNLYSSDSSTHRIRKIDSNGMVSTLAGDGTAGYLDGTGTNTMFNTPHGVASDPYGNVYVADKLNNRIRKIQ